MLTMAMHGEVESGTSEVQLHCDFFVLDPRAFTVSLTFNLSIRYLFVCLFAE